MSNKNILPNTLAGTFKGVYLVRGPDGNVKYTDPLNVPQEILGVLTPADKAHLKQLKSQTPQ